MILYYTILFYTILYYTRSYYIIRYYAVLLYYILNYTILRASAPETSRSQGAADLRLMGACYSGRPEWQPQPQTRKATPL